MSGLIDSYKKIYEDKKAHLWIFLIALVWTVASTNFDIFLQEGVPKNNPIDLVFNILIGILSLKFLHEAINNSATSILNKIDLGFKNILILILLNIVWGVYAVIAATFALVAYIATHSFILPILIISALLLISVFVYYIFLGFADDFNSKGLWNIKRIFDFIKPTYKDLYIKTILFILFTIFAAVIYVLIYTVAGLTGIDKIWNIAGDWYALDLLMNSFAAYFCIVTWYFAFPYSLISSYKEKVRPILGKDE